MYTCTCLNVKKEMVYTLGDQIHINSLTINDFLCNS